MASILRWLIVLVFGEVSTTGVQTRAFFHRAHLRAGMNSSAATRSSALQFVGKPMVLVITVPNRPSNTERMERLGGWLTAEEYRYEAVSGPNMDNYCPADISVNEQSKAAGMRLLKEEWHGRVPDLSTYNLELFQMATLCGHLRAWQHIVDSQTPAVILEDDAEVQSSDLLQDTVTRNEAAGADAILLDRRHCVNNRPPYLWQQASGLAGYWVNVKAARSLLAHFPLSLPVDWGVNQIFNDDVHCMCPGVYPVAEHGGQLVARKQSAAHDACQPGDGGDSPQDEAHPVSTILAGLMSFR